MNRKEDVRREDAKMSSQIFVSKNMYKRAPPKGKRRNVKCPSVAGSSSKRRPYEPAQVFNHSLMLPLQLLLKFLPFRVARSYIG